ncbi:hypothetical protein V2O64_03055 [Verrucomicrobiaceae bacterium 227]
MSLSGWELTNALRGYIQGAAREGGWKTVINDLQGFEDRRGLNRDATGLRPETQGMIASEWIKENFEEGIQWFTQEIERDFANPGDVTEVISALAHLPTEKHYQVIDWVEQQRDQAGWSDEIALNYAPILAHSPLDGNTERLVGLISSEEDRFKFVASLIGTTEPSHRVTLQHSPESLIQLIEAAELTEANATQLKSVIDLASWSGVR